MARTAHILIKEVHNDSNKVLQTVRVLLDLDISVSNPATPIELKKDDIKYLIEDGDTVRTVYVDTSTGKWVPGAKVNVVTVGGKKYLRTDSNYLSQDNLDKLPTY